MLDEDLRSEVTCYVIDADTSYNLLLGRPWIHCNSIVPSILHQVMKYVDGDGKVQTLITEMYPFKGGREQLYRLPPISGFSRDR